MQITALSPALAHASGPAGHSTAPYPPEHSPEDFRAEATSALVTLEEAVQLLGAIRSGSGIDPTHGVQLGRDMVTLLSWARSELDDATNWTGGLGSQTGIDVRVARRHTDAAMRIWEGSPAQWQTHAGVLHLATRSEPFIDQARTRIQRALDRLG